MDAIHEKLEDSVREKQVGIRKNTTKCCVNDKTHRGH